MKVKVRGLGGGFSRIPTKDTWTQKASFLCDEHVHSRWDVRRCKAKAAAARSVAVRGFDNQGHFARSTWGCPTW